MDWCPSKGARGLSDTVSHGVRSRIMAAIKGKDTKPELIVRKAIHGRGLRFRLHRRSLPGTPDIVLPRYRLVIFVHGCFWHQHQGCKIANMPKSRIDYWQAKLAKNQERDRSHIQELEDMGWTVATIWECEAKVPSTLSARLDAIFGTAEVTPA